MTTHSTDIYAEYILPLDKETIRVLVLKPGDESDRITAQLLLLDLGSDTIPQYECLSYAWGDPTLVQPAVINKQCIQITVNLDNALRYIRSKNKEVIIWADAICINQSSIDEKEQQVAFMAEIYRRCSKVYIWLGVPQPGSLTGDPFRFLEHFNQGKHFHDFPGFALDQSTEKWTWKRNEACDSILNDMLQVVASPWWTRAWTVPECLLPRNTMIMFGSWTTTWDFILEANNKKTAHVDDATECCVESIKVFNAPQLGLINDWAFHPGWTDRFRTKFHEDRIHSPPWFYEALLAFSSRKCSEPRDKIYSMLSLAGNPVYQGFRPNYRQDVSTVYTDIFTRMVQELNGNFDCFMGGAFGSSMAGLPSWVRDFSQTKAARVIAGEERRIWYAWRYQASLATSIPVQLIENRELHCRGIYADTIRAVGLPMNPPDTFTPESDISEVFHQWLDLCKEVMGHCESRVLRNTFSRIICGDICKTVDEGAVQFRRARETDFPEEAVWHRLVDGNINAMDLRGFGWGLGFAMWGRCFFTTYLGKMGLCHPQTLQEDEVWVMRGVRVPLVIRPLEHTDASCAGEFSFVGDCFLHGIMDGELGEKEKLMERRIVIVLKGFEPVERTLGLGRSLRK